MDRTDHIFLVVQAEGTSGEFRRDRAARAVRILLHLLRAGAARRLRVGAEVAGAGRLRRGRIEARTAEAPAAGPGPAEATAAAAEAAGAGAAEAAAGTRGPGAAILAGACFAHRKGPAVEQHAVELLNGLFRIGAILELDEREAARTTGLTLTHDVDRRDRTSLLEMRRVAHRDVSALC